MVVNEEFAGLLLAELLQRICPQDVAHEAVGRRFAESVNLEVLTDLLELDLKTTYTFDIVQRMQLRAETAMYAKELLVHDSS